MADRVRESVVRTLSRYNMLRFGRRLGVAVSGGADSVCLLHLLAGLSAELGLDLTVLHINHRLRGVESDGDAAFVSGLAESLGIGWQERALDPVLLKQGNVEQNAREARLECFAEWRERLRLDAIAVAHTRSDQAETVLMRLIRGTGPAGLGGIQAVTVDRRIRPLIATSSAEVRQWLSGASLAWREDSSNRSRKLTRNRVRLEILPALARENPRIEESLARLAELAGEEEEYWERLTAGVLDEIASRGEGEIVLNAEALAGLDRPVARRVLKAASEHAAGGRRGLELIHNEDLLRLAVERKEGSASLAGLVATRSFTRLRLARGGLAGVCRPEGEAITGAGEYGGAWLGHAIRLKCGSPPAGEGFQVFWPGGRYNGGRHWLDGDAAGFPLVLRGWRHGDRYQPHGAKREYSLHELFQRLRVPRWERSRWPVIVSEEGIVWARRFGVAQWAAAAPGSANAIEVIEASRRV